VRSANTAVICAKPFRENDRVDSSPGIPASAVSSATVTCFSISTGVSAGAVAFTWTWTLVTSGTASIGSFVRDHKPDAAATSVTSRTSHLRRIEKSTILSIIVSVLVAGLRQFRLQRERVRNGHGFAGREPRNDLDGLAIALAEYNVALLEPVLGADEHGLAALDGLDGTERRDDGAARSSIAIAAVMNDPGRHRPSAFSMAATTRAVRVSLSSRGLTNTILPVVASGKPRNVTATDCPSRIIGKSGDETESSTQTWARSTMTKSSVSRLSRPTAVPSSTLRSATRPEIGARRLAAQRGVRRLRKRGDLIFTHAQRQQFLARNSEAHRGLRRGVARFDVLLFWNGAALPERLIPGGQILLQFVRESGSEIVALGVCYFAALQDGYDFVLHDIVADVLRSSATVPESLTETWATRPASGTMVPDTPMRFAIVAGPTVCCSIWASLIRSSSIASTADFVSGTLGWASRCATAARGAPRFAKPRSAGEAEKATATPRGGYDDAVGAYGHYELGRKRSNGSRRHRYREIALNSARTFLVDLAGPPFAAASRQLST